LDRGLGRQAGGCGERIEAEGGQLVSGHIVPDLSGRGGVGDQVADKVAEVLLRAGYVRGLVQVGCELAAVSVAELVLDQRVGLQYRF
jgi:hypothetical protein